MKKINYIIGGIIVIFTIPFILFFGMIGFIFKKQLEGALEEDEYHYDKLLTTKLESKK